MIAAGPSSRCQAGPIPRLRGLTPLAARTAWDGKRYLPRQDQRRHRQRRPTRQQTPCPDHRTTRAHMPQVPDAELLTAAMRQERPSGPTDDIDGEPSRAQNTPIGTGTWPLDLDPQAAPTADSASAQR